MDDEEQRRFPCRSVLIEGVQRITEWRGDGAPPQEREVPFAFSYATQPDASLLTVALMDRDEVVLVAPAS